MRERWLVIINPVAGKGNGHRFRTLIETELNARSVPYEMIVTSRKGDAERAARQAFSLGYRRIAVVGGDGTMNEVVNGIPEHLGTDLPEIALLGNGTGDDWRRTLNIPAHPEQAIDVMISGEMKTVDMGSVEFDDGTKRHFANMCGIGISGGIIDRISTSRRGKSTYLLGLLKTLPFYKPPVVTIKPGMNNNQTSPCLLLSIAIGRFAGGGMQLAPQADESDGLLDVVMIPQLSLSEIAWNIRRVFTGSLLDYRKVRHWKLDSVQVDSEPPCLVEADGEVLGRLPATFRVVSPAYRVRVPKTS